MVDQVIPISDSVASGRWAVELLRDLADAIEAADEDALEGVLLWLPLGDLERQAGVSLGLFHPSRRA